MQEQQGSIASDGFWVSLWRTPAADGSTLYRYTVWNGIAYLAIGASMYLAPGLVRVLLFMPPFQGYEEGYLRLVGVAVAVIGWLYVFGGRARSESFGLCSVVDRMLLPVLLLPLAVMNLAPAGPVIAFSILDPLLAAGAYLIWRRERRSGA